VLIEVHTEAHSLLLDSWLRLSSISFIFTCLFPSALQVNNAAVIVDPSVKQVIASARDEICSWNTPTNKTTIQTSSCKQPDTCISHSDSDRVITHDTLTSNGSTSEPKQLCTDASCLYPWRWSEQEFYTPNSSCWHPLRHAAIVAIESSAARDRQLFPGLGNIEDKSFELDNMHSSTSSPAKRQKINVKIVSYHFPCLDFINLCWANFRIH
jgi:tRNA-specific adenosine deaminase 3